MEDKKERYLLKQTIHFGFLKETFGKGSEFIVDKNSGTIEVDGRSFKDLRDVEICIRNKYLIPYCQEEKEIISNSIEQDNKKESNIEKKIVPKMKVIKSDSDLMEREIDISHIRNKNVEKEGQHDLDVLREETKEDIRGVKVIRRVSEIEDYQVIGDPSGQISEDSDSIVVAKIPKKTDNEVKIKPAGRPKGSKNKKTLENLKNRKIEIAKNRQKMINENK